MRISLQNAGKRFNRDWIFREVTYSFDAQKKYIITGPNGSGKSTLLQVIAGLVPLSTGTTQYFIHDQPVSSDEIYRHLVIASPYQELIEEFTFSELIRFHFKFKRFKGNCTIEQLAEIIELTHTWNKPVKFFSSGMKTRLKLGLAFLSEVPLILLDEPTSNLDTNGIQWYQHMLHTYCTDQTLILCSNQSYEYEGLTNVLHIENTQLKQR